jgi:hypothetical protein
MASLPGTLRLSRISASWCHIDNVTRQSAGRENRKQRKGRQNREANLERPESRLRVDANRLDNLFGRNRRALHYSQQPVVTHERDVIEIDLRFEIFWNDGVVGKARRNIRAQDADQQRASDGLRQDCSLCRGATQHHRPALWES